MKVSFLSTALGFAFLSTWATAEVTLGPFPDVVDIGNTYTLSWTATENYTYTLWLVAETAGEGGYGWTKVLGLDTGMEFDYLQGNYTWTVPGNLSSASSYGLWLDGFNIPFNGESYASMTDWFMISPSSPYSSSSSTTTSSATTAHGVNLTPTTPTVRSSSTSLSTPTSTPTDSTSTPVQSHHTSLSGGAIAGIVIGILVAIALIVVAVIVGKWRSKRTALQKREAAARDNRLAPVMAAGANEGSFELNPGVNKDFNV